MIEITGLKFGENKTFSDCIKGFMPPILDEIVQKVFFKGSKTCLPRNWWPIPRPFLAFIQNFSNRIFKIWKIRLYLFNKLK